MDINAIQALNSEAYILRFDFRDSQRRSDSSDPNMDVAIDVAFAEPLTEARTKEIEDAVSSYIEGVDDWQDYGLIEEVLYGFGYVKGTDYVYINPKSTIDI